MLPLWSAVEPGASGITIRTMKRIRQHAVLVALVITLAIFGRAAFFARHAGAQNSPAPTLQTEIAQVESRVDALEGEAVTQAGQVYPGAPEAVVVLGKLLFFDKNLSVNRNTKLESRRRDGVTAPHGALVGD